MSMVWYPKWYPEGAGTRSKPDSKRRMSTDAVERAVDSTPMLGDAAYGNQEVR